MQELNYWEQFEHTGSVADYLSYIRNEEEKKNAIHGETAGVNPYAGIRMCNRDDIETDAYRGI